MDTAALVALVVVVGCILGVRVAAARAVTVAQLAVEGGHVRVVRGGIAPPVLADVRDVARQPPIDRLRIDIVRSSGRAEVRFSGRVTDEQAQRLRNVIGSVPLARLMNAVRR